MDRDNVIKGNALIKKIDDLSRYKAMLINGDYGKSTHFEIVQHYAVDTNDRDYKIIIDTKYNDRLIKAVDEIIAELELELKAL